MPLRKLNDVKQVEPGARTGNTAPDTGRDRDRDNGTEAAAARDIGTLRREMEQRNLPAGPPPSFEVSQLEIDTDFQAVIARLEAARTQAREADALKLDAETEERLAKAEMSQLAGEETGTRQPSQPPAGETPSGPHGAETAAGASTRLDAHV